MPWLNPQSVFTHGYLKTAPPTVPYKQNITPLLSYSRGHLSTHQLSYRENQNITALMRLITCIVSYSSNIPCSAVLFQWCHQRPTCTSFACSTLERVRARKCPAVVISPFVMSHGVPPLCYWQHSHRGVCSRSCRLFLLKVANKGLFSLGAVFHSVRLH